MAPVLLRSLAVLALLAGWPSTGQAQESVQAAQALYASASYEEALALLDRLQQRALPPVEVRLVNQQRALCLLALGRQQDAELAITAIVQADPTYRPTNDMASPRVRAVFRDVRSRLLPPIVQAEYAEARRQYGAKAWADAAAAFQRVAALAIDPDLAEGQIAALADLKVLADDFAALAVVAATPPPSPPVAPGPPPPPPVDYDALYDSSHTDVVPPVTLRQDLPRWSSPTRPRQGVSGVLEVTITKSGVVERATIAQPVAAWFDRLVLDATKNWKYQPAMLDGQPVRFRKTIKITFQ